ncbi:MAG: family 16 glycosylhydrolase [Ktedonobacterales bacterium]|nr:family 16 glycosylhydrolase [Ktedonobacterales bacterium]
MQLFSHRNRDSQPRTLPILRTLVLVVCAVALGAFGVLSLGAHPQVHAASWTQIWGDDFNGTNGTAPSSTNWRYDLGTGYGCAGCPNNWGTGEVESNTNSTANVYLDGSGHLAIKPIRDGSGNWTSGRIETQQTNFTPPAGGELAVEATIQQPNVSGAAAAGYWPAFWMLGSAFRGVYTNWPGIGEVDIMEDINGLSSEFGTLHCGVNPGGPCNETTGIGSGQHTVGGLQTAFHTYRVEIDRSVAPEQIRWYLDGSNFFTINANQVDATTWANAVDHSFFIILNVAMGGGFPAAFGGGPTGATQSGNPMLIDYVHVFTAGGCGTSCPTPTTAPTSTPSGSGFTQGVNAIGSNQAQFWFKPNGWTAGYAIVHYTIAGQGQQNVTMTYNSSTARWEFTAGGFAVGTTVTYAFTYSKGGTQYDTPTYSWTDGGGSATPTPTPITCSSGNFAEGVVNTGATAALPWFQPCGWTAGYVIIHYTIPGQVQQNVTMTYNSGTARWEYGINGLNAGQTLTFSFTYQKAGTQFDSGTYTWTHP